MYLGDYQHSLNVKNLIDNLFKEYKFTFEGIHRLIPYEHFEIFAENYSFKVNSFPGNCSSLVLSSIQDHFHYLIEHNVEKNPILEFTEKLTKLLKYACLFITVTDETVLKYLLENGYNIIMENDNPHSDNHNYFLVKYFEY